jgi:hypothetical protein
VGALGYVGEASLGVWGEIPIGLALERGNVEVPQTAPAPHAPPDGNSEPTKPSLAVTVPPPPVGELVAPTPALGTADPFLALQEFVGGAEALGHDLAVALNSFLHSHWAAITAAALAAGEACRRRVRKADWRHYPPIDMPEITGPSGLA